MSIRFGTDGWRALMDEDFTADNLRMVAQGIAGYLLTQDHERGVVVGYDTRRNSPEFARLCAEVFSTYGIPVHLTTRPTPTPVVAFTILGLHAAGGIMITASHNPPAYNGIKFISSAGGPAPASVTRAIEKEIAGASEQAPHPEGPRPELIHPVSRILDYRAHISTIVNYEITRRSGLTVGVDPMYGAGYGILDRMVEEDAGCRTVDCHNHPDPEFGGGMPEPAPEYLQDLKSLVFEEKAALGVALDGDGDRFGAVDSTGYIPSSNEILALLTQYLLDKGHRGAIVRSIATTHLLDAIAAEHGIEVIETPVGFKHIAEVMIDRPVLIGGEESGGLSVGRHIPEKDGLLADMLLVQMVAERGRSLSELLVEIHDRYGHFRSERIDLHLPPERRDALVKSLVDNPPRSIAGLPVVDVDQRDGVRLALDGSDWVLVRPSGTEPMVRTYVESRDAERFPALCEAAIGLVREQAG